MTCPSCGDYLLMTEADISTAGSERYVYRCKCGRVETYIRSDGGTEITSVGGIPLDSVELEDS